MFLYCYDGFVFAIVKERLTSEITESKQQFIQIIEINSYNK